MNLIVDSGMFGAWARGETIDPDAYIDFIRRNEEFLFAYVSIDAIPGSPGKRKHVSEQESADCAKLSYKNHQYLKRAGLHPIPVFHQYEPIEWLDRYLDDGEPYVGISPYLRSHKSEIRTWLDKCFLRLTNEKGLPIVRTHGFGMTTTEFLAHYPWFSVDSTSWVMAGAYGSVAVPLPRGDGYDYTQPKLITLTNRPNRRANNFDLLVSLQQPVQEYFSAIGLDLALLRNDDKVRYKAALVFNRELAKQIGRVRFSPGIRNHDRGCMPSIHIPAVRIFAATTPALPKNEALNEIGVDDRLLSYRDIRDQPDHFLATYSKTGLPLGQSKFRPTRYGQRGYEKMRALAHIKRFGTGAEFQS